ncbi:MAG TPA: sulfite oxidase [Egibacteraceae bacterium]|nr:sulfite oxidase [Egibacteraceae bacterium]
MTSQEYVTLDSAEQPGISIEELQLATRNHGMPLEALRYDVTPLGLHYLLTHFDIPALDPATWRLRIGGWVARPLTLTLDELRARPTVTRRVTMECAGNGRARLSPRPVSQPWLLEAVGTGEWTGTPAADVIDEAGVTPDAIEVVFTGADRGVQGGVEHAYARSITLDELRATGALLAWGLNGVALPPQHGAPVRLVVPGWYGMTSVKWLTSIDLTTTPFDGYQQAGSYRFRQTPDEVGDPVTRLAVRSLMIPPGIPDFLTRRRIVDRGTHELRGRAWAGRAPIAAVEVSTDGGRTWQGADLHTPSDPAAWTAWRAVWHADAPGETEVCCRARDTSGNAQPDTPSWNLGGYAVNAVQRVAVTVR